MLWVFFVLLVAAQGDGDGIENLGDGEWQFYVAENEEKMVLTVAMDGITTGCLVFADRYAVGSVLKLAPDLKTTKLDSAAIDQMVKACSLSKGNEWLFDKISQKHGILDGLAIYPGTKWCGAGNIADDYDDLGPEVETDKCCRDHDHCNDSIAAGDTKHGLKNDGLVTKSNCYCDDKFYHCLQEADTDTSNRVGRIFFNYLQMQCFKLEYPIVGCKRYVGLIRRRCQEYELDENGEKEWQFFDAKKYVSSHKDGKNVAEII